MHLIHNSCLMLYTIDRFIFCLYLFNVLWLPIWQIKLYIVDSLIYTLIQPSALRSIPLHCSPPICVAIRPSVHVCFVLSLQWFGPSRLRLCVKARLKRRTFVCRCRRGVTEVYGDLNDIDSIDWAKISNVDVCLHSLSLLVSLVKARVVLTSRMGSRPVTLWLWPATDHAWTTLSTRAY